MINLFLLMNIIRVIITNALCLILGFDVTFLYVCCSPLLSDMPLTKCRESQEKFKVLTYSTVVKYALDLSV